MPRTAHGWPVTPGRTPYAASSRSPVLIFYALSLEYVTQINYSGIRYSYMGTYLSLPVALLFVRGLARATSRDRQGALVGFALSAVLAAWYIGSGAAVTRGTVYRDAARSQLTASFQTRALTGIQSTPQNVRRVDGVVEAVRRDSRPGDPILAFPDFPVLYLLTGRSNPTRIDWYDPGEIIPSMAEEAVRDLERNPPRVVILEQFDEADFARQGLPLDYTQQPKWLPVYQYVISHYHRVDSIGDLDVLTQGTGP